MYGFETIVKTHFDYFHGLFHTLMVYFFSYPQNNKNYNCDDSD